MPRGKTPQDLYRERRQREDDERGYHLPPGLANHGNTCFMNSVLQGLIAIPYLQQMVMMQLAHSPRSPALTNGRGGPFEKEWANGLTLSDVFLNVIGKAWRMKDTRQRNTMSPKEILSALGTKYDQYNDFRQQDAHEFLRLLLDGMRMEEFDIIKKRQPRQLKSKKLRRKYSKSGEEDLPPIPPEEHLVPFVDAVFTGQLASILVCETCHKVSVTKEPFDDLSLSIKPDEKERKRDRLKIFAHKFKINTASLSGSGASGDSPPPRPLSVPPPAKHPVSTIPDDLRRRSLERETQPMDTDPATAAAAVPSAEVLPGAGHRAGNKPAEFLAATAGQAGDLGARLGRQVSKRWTKRRSKDKGKEKEKPAGMPDEISRVASAPPATPHLEEARLEPILDVPRIRASPLMVADSLQSKQSSRSPSPFRRQRERRPSRAQRDYVQSLLADVQGNSPLNPFSYLPPGSSLGKLAPGQGLEQCLRQFTAVELLEGENMYACRRCWKIAHGTYHPPTDHERAGRFHVGDDDDDSDDDRDRTPAATDPASISPASTGAISNVPDNVSNLDLASSVASLPPKFAPMSLPRSNGISHIPQITTVPPNSPPTPQRSVDSKHPSVHFRKADGSSLKAPDLHFTRSRKMQSVVSEEGSSVSFLSSDDSSSDVSSDTSITSQSSGSTSSSDSAKAKALREKRAKEVIMRKAFKRYLVAEAPPVLVIHLKRFHQVTKSPAAIFGNLKKLDDYVPFPEYLDLSAYLAPNPEDFGYTKKRQGRRGAAHKQCTIYRLVSVVVHIGNMLGGHYIAYTALPDQMASPESPEPAEADCKIPLSKRRPRRWCYISDTTVRFAELDEVLKSKAYICMYERLDTVQTNGDYVKL